MLTQPQQETQNNGLFQGAVDKTFASNNVLYSRSHLNIDGGIYAVIYNYISLTRRDALEKTR